MGQVMEVEDLPLREITEFVGEDLYDQDPSPLRPMAKKGMQEVESELLSTKQVENPDQNPDGQPDGKSVTHITEWQLLNVRSLGQRGSSLTQHAIPRTGDAGCEENDRLIFEGFLQESRTLILGFYCFKNTTIAHRIVWSWRANSNLREELAFGITRPSSPMEEDSMEGRQYQSQNWLQIKSSIAVF